MRKYEFTFGIVVVIWALVLLLGWNDILSRTGAGLGLDDGYIHLVYARNLLDGHFFQFNIGETSSGSTSPLWVFLLSALGAATGLIYASWILSALSLLASALAALFLCRKILHSLNISGEPQNFASSLSAILVLLYGRFLWHTFSGMETLLFSATITFQIALFIDEVQHSKRFLWSAIVASIAIWIRPETLLLFVIMVPAYIIASLPKTRRAFLPIAIMLCSISTHFLFNILLTGHLLPNTFFSKSAIYRGDRWDYLLYTISTFWHDNFLLFIGAVVGGIVLVIFAIKRRRLAAVLAVVWCFGLPATKFLVSIPEVHFGRYTIVIVPVLVPLACWSIVLLQKSWQRWTLAAAMLIPSIIVLPKWIDMCGKTIEQINTVHGETAKWLLANTDQNALIATHDVGRIKYDTSRKILDLVGLTSNEATMLIWQKREIIQNSYICLDSIGAKLLIKHHPDIVVISPVWFPYLSGNRDALKFLWRTYQYTDAVECVPELDVYEMLPGADTTIFNFYRYGMALDKQSILGIFVPQASQFLSCLFSMPQNARADYIKNFRAEDEQIFPYLRISLRRIIGDLLSWQKYDEALVIAIFGCELYADDAVLWNARGALLSQEKRFSDAVKSFARAVALAPDKAQFRRNYAITLLNNNDTINAIAQLDTVIMQNRSDTIAMSIREKISEHQK